MNAEERWASAGIGASPDPAFDRFAEMVRSVLGTPAAVVALLAGDRQFLPGARGLGAPWQQSRQAPRFADPHAAPLVVRDARQDGRPAVADLGAAGFAGMPLTDADGTVLGSLCAIDTDPRDWTERELGLLADLAATCSDTLRLRLAAGQARDRRDRALSGQARSDAAFDRSQLLLRASVALSSTSTSADVVSVVNDLVSGTLGPAFVSLSLLDDEGQISLESAGALPGPLARQWSRYSPTATTPSALAARSGAPVLLPTLDDVAARTPDALETFAEMGWKAVASVPLPGPHGAIGALTFVWKESYAVRDTEQAVLAALAGYVSQALQRAAFLTARVNTAAILQQAMLTDLPDTAPFELAARYQPAARGERVGGDWYDAVRLDDRLLALVVGDVSGHDMRAAAGMGQLRNMLRAFLVDRTEPPSALLGRLDAAGRALGPMVPATAVLAYVRRDPSGYRLQWANAGHPPPLLIEPGGRVTVLAGRDPLLGLKGGFRRADHTHPLPPGATLLLHTDGLIESRTRQFDDGEEELAAAAARLHDADLPDLLDRLLITLAGDDHEDDVAMLALRVPGR